MLFSTNIHRRWHWTFFLFFCLGISVLASCHGAKPRDKSQIAAPKEAETLPKDPSHLNQIKEDALRQMENNGLGIFSIHPDAKNAPPTIFSPDAFPKEHPDDSKPDSKQ